MRTTSEGDIALIRPEPGQEYGMNTVNHLQSVFSYAEQRRLGHQYRSKRSRSNHNLALSDTPGMCRFIRRSHVVQRHGF